MKTTTKVTSWKFFLLSSGILMKFLQQSTLFSAVKYVIPIKQRRQIMIHIILIRVKVSAAWVQSQLVAVWIFDLTLIYIHLNVLYWMWNNLKSHFKIYCFFMFKIYDSILQTNLFVGSATLIHLCIIQGNLSFFSLSHPPTQNVLKEINGKKTASTFFIFLFSNR